MSPNGSNVRAPAIARSAPPPISVGMPVYNGGTMLMQALDALLAQTYGDFELVISDNASTDSTVEVLRDYAARDKRIRFFRQPYNIGIDNNWTFVARQSRGTYLKWASSNDDYAPNLLEECLAPMQNDRTVVLCYGRTCFIDLAGKRLGIYGGDFEALSADPVERYRAVREHLHLCTPMQAGLIRLDALRRCGYLSNYRDSDRVMLAGLALIGKFVLLSEVLFYRRWDRSAASPLRGPLEIERLYHPDATKPTRFVNLPRHVGQLRAAMLVPPTLGGKARALVAAVRYTDWRRKFLGPRHGVRSRQSRVVHGSQPDALQKSNR